MKITEVKVSTLTYPEGSAVADATMAPKSAKGYTFVHILTDEGITGLGIGKSAPGIKQIVESIFAPILIGQDPYDIEKLWDLMYWAIRSFGRKGVAFQAISSVDISLWDLKAKSLDLPLYKLLGAFSDAVPIYGSGGWTNYTEEQLVREMTDYVDRGIPRVKMKVGKDFGKSEKEDLQRLELVRKSVGDDIEIFVDANWGYYPKQAIMMAKQFENYNIGWFEEPTTAEDIAGLSEIRHSISMPLASGELEYSKYGFKELISRGGCDIAQPDVGHVGGITEWLKIAHIAHSFNIQIAPHAHQLVHLHLGCATPNLKVIEYMNTSLEIDRIFFNEFPQQKGGMWKPFHDKPGLGLDLNPKAVEKWAV